jgi:hypothetical protein
LKCPERHILDVEPSHICLHPRQRIQVLTIHVLKIVETTKNPQTVKLSPRSSGLNPTWPICKQSNADRAQTAHISLHSFSFQRARRQKMTRSPVSERIPASPASRFCGPSIKLSLSLRAAPVTSPLR